MDSKESVGGRAQHVDAHYYFLHELKEEGILEVRWIYGDDNCCDLYTKNLTGPSFDKHASVFCGVDKYMNGYADTDGIQGEGVRGWPK